MEICLLIVEFSVDIDQIVKLNFERKLDEISKVTSIWSKRKLTPLGKITVLKTLITCISKLKHLFISLPNPSDKILKDLNTLSYNFIWNGKTDRVNRELLAQDEKREVYKCLTLKSLFML